ncbi:MAG: restriction endonuclease subunit S [Candidatus Omnitrophota bacterium]
MRKKILDSFCFLQYTSRMKNKIKLKHIVDIIAGYTFRGAIEEHFGSSLFALQAKNIKKDALSIDVSGLVATNCDTSHTKAFIEPNDVVISNKGVFRSAVVRSNKKILASSSVYILRAKDNNIILPDYLALYLNSPIGQQKFSHLMTGAAIKYILRKDIENIKINLLSVEDQRKLVDLYLNISMQITLLEKKCAIKKNIINGLLNKIVGE